MYVANMKVYRLLLTNELIFLIFFLNKNMQGRPFGTNNFILNTFMNIKKETLLTAGIFSFQKELL